MFALFLGAGEPNRRPITALTQVMTAVTRGLRVLLTLVVCLPAAAHAATVAAGAEHTVVVTPDGHVWTWGRNEYGQLGDGTNTDRLVPTPVPGLTNIVAVSTNTYHTLALASDGTVWAWGADYYGQLGDSTTTGQSQNTPVHLSLTNVVAISAGHEHSLGLQADGTVWSWGDNYFGQLGRSTTGRTDPTPAIVTAFGSVAAISAGSEHSLVRKADGTICGVGGNWAGQLGDTTTSNRPTPVQASGVTTAQALSGTGAHAIVRVADGSLAAFGWNGYGQLGNNTTTDATTPIAVPSFADVSQVAAGWYYSAAIKTDGTAWAWGANSDGQLGDGTTTTRWVPTASRRCRMSSRSPPARIRRIRWRSRPMASSGRGVPTATASWVRARPSRRTPRSRSAGRTTPGRWRRRPSVSGPARMPRIKPSSSPV